MPTDIVGYLDGQPVYRVTPEPDPERDLRKDLGLDKDPWGDEASDRAERTFDRCLARPAWSPIDMVPKVGPVVRDLGYIDPADFTRSWCP